MSFAVAMAFTRLEEKGLVNDPNDPGGRTYDGIAEHANPEAWRDGVVTEQELVEAYLKRWEAIRGDYLPSAVAVSVFDFYFQSGVHAVRNLQRVLGVAVDGDLGPKTRSAILSRNPRDLALDLVMERARFLTDWVNALPVKPDGKGGLRPSRIRFSCGFARRLSRLSFRIATL